MIDIFEELIYHNRTILDTFLDEAMPRLLLSFARKVFYGKKER